MTSTGYPESGVERRVRRVRRILWALLGLLAVEFALGMAVNLFVSLSLPSGYPEVLSVIESSGVLSAHAVVAVLVLFGSVVLCTQTGKPFPARVRGLSVLLAVTIVGTIFMGYSFVESQSNAFSYGMAMGFLVAFLLVVGLVHSVHEMGRRAPTPETTKFTVGG
jgi:cytochrome bd-type quinol oxidase subunit 2